MDQYCFTISGSHATMLPADISREEVTVGNPGGDNIVADEHVYPVTMLT